LNILRLFITALTIYRRQYYERNNLLISQYLYIDQLLNSSLPHYLIEEYNDGQQPIVDQSSLEEGRSGDVVTAHQNSTKIKRTPRNLYRIPSETSLLLPSSDTECDEAHPGLPSGEHTAVDSGDHIVTVAIQVNLVANILLLVAKVVVITMTSSLSVFASLVDGGVVIRCHHGHLFFPGSHRVPATISILRS
jgi:hypothetical protein